MPITKESDGLLTRLSNVDPALSSADQGIS
jgi:hypothetical protein